MPSNRQRQFSVQRGPGLNDAFRKPPRGADQTFNMRRDLVTVASTYDPIGLPKTVELKPFRVLQIPFNAAFAAINA